MNIFDIIGPIMIGPSSSHTAGVVRIGLIAYNIFGHTPKHVTITFYGSFAKTYQGHGSDKAVIGGLLGMNTSDENIKCSLEIATKKEIKYEFITSDKLTSHPNTLKISGTDINDNKVEIVGQSIGGGNINICKINDLSVELDGTYDTLLINHIDIAGVIKNTTNALYNHKINIANMKVFRSEKGGDAMMIIESDEKLDHSILDEILMLQNIKSAVIIPSI